MKLLLTLLLLTSTTSLIAQSWCDPGANWKYSYFTAFGAEGYTEINYTGDTIINGQAAQKLDKHILAYQYMTSQVVDFDLGMDFTYENNGVVYVWFENNWDTLYNFNATVGESWRMAKQPITNACDSNSYLTVTATGTKTINAVTLNYLVVDFGFPNSYSDTIVEKIGFIGSYMFPYDGCDGELDVNEGGAFRCYEDANFATYKPNYSGPCDFIYTGIEENEMNASFQVIPNPAVTQIEIIGELGSETQFFIVDSFGKNCSVVKTGTTIDVSNLPSGMYVLSILNDSKISHHKFIVQ